MSAVPASAPERLSLCSLVGYLAAVAGAVRQGDASPAARRPPHPTSERPMPIVGVVKPLDLNGHLVQPGARMIARKDGDQWMVLLNGLEVKVPRGSVDLVDSKAVRQVEERRTARDEEYAVAPSKPS